MTSLAPIASGVSRDGNTHHILLAARVELARIKCVLHRRPFKCHHRSNVNVTPTILHTAACNNSNSQCSHRSHYLYVEYTFVYVWIQSRHIRSCHRKNEYLLLSDIYYFTSVCVCVCVCVSVCLSV